MAALIRMSDIAIPALARGLQNGLQNRGLNVGLVVELDTRLAIVEVLSRIRTADAVGVLETALNDSAPAVRQTALTVSGHIRPADRTSSGLRVFEGGN